MSKENWTVLLDDEGGIFYETEDGRVAYEKENGTIVGPTENDAVRSAYNIRKYRLENEDA